MRAIPEWTIQTCWWASGIFATGAVWYFLSQGSYLYTGLAAIGALAFWLLAIFLHRRKDASPKPSSDRSPESKISHLAQNADQPAEQLRHPAVTASSEPSQHESPKPEPIPSRHRPLTVRFADGTSASVDFYAFIHVEAQDAADFVSRYGTYENGILTCHRLLESVVRSTIEEQPNAQKIRENRLSLESSLKDRATDQLAGTFLTVDAVRLGEIRNA